MRRGCSKFLVLVTLLCTGCSTANYLVASKWREDCSSIPSVQLPVPAANADGYELTLRYRKADFNTGKVHEESKNDPYYYPLTLSQLVEEGLMPEGGYSYKEYELIRDWGSRYESDLNYPTAKGIYRAERVPIDHPDCTSFRSWIASKNSKKSFPYCIVVRPIDRMTSRYRVEKTETYWFNFPITYEAYRCKEMSVVDKETNSIIFSGKNCTIGRSGWVGLPFPDVKYERCGNLFELEKVLVPVTRNE